MIRNTTVIIGVCSISKGPQGQILKNFTYDAVNNTFVCDVQPFRFNEYDYHIWGISDFSEDAKAMWCDLTLSGFFPLLEPVNRIRVVGGADYDIRGANKWQHHKVLLLNPAQGEGDVPPS